MNKVIVEFEAVNGRAILPLEDIGAITEMPTGHMVQKAFADSRGQTPVEVPTQIFDKGSNNWLNCVESYEVVRDRVQQAGDLAGCLVPHKAPWAPEDPTPLSKETEDE